MPRKRSRARVFKPKAPKMWVEALEQRVLLAAPDFAGPGAISQARSSLSSSTDDQAFHDKASPSSFSEPMPPAASEPKRARDGDDLVIFIV